ncbi:MAG: hypothetical protein Q9214_004373, partial [Letrouitia sp. 1 TL-2023]
PIVFLNDVGVEQSLFYNSWLLADPVTVLGISASGVTAHTPPNAIATSAEIQALNGTPAITSIYPGSKVKAFDFRSFWFGCSAPTGQGAVSAAKQCSVLVAGFRGGKEVASGAFTFTPTVEEELADPMIEAVLDGGFVGLQNVTLVQVDTVTEVLLVDSVSTVIYT